MTAYTWKTSVASGNWSTNGDWNTAGSPSAAADTASISGANIAVTFDPASVSMTSLAIGGVSGTFTDSLALGGNTLNLSTTVQMNNGAGGSYTITLAGGKLAAGTNLTFAGSRDTISGYGTISATGTLTGAGTLYANSSGHLLDATAGTWKGGGAASVLEIANGATLELHGTIPTGENISFDSTAGGVLALTQTGANFSGSILGASLGVQTGGTSPTSVNFIDLVNAGGITSASINTVSNISTLSVVTSSSGTYTLITNENLTGDSVNWKADTSLGASGFDIWVDTAPCYAVGTRLGTPSGDVAVEALSEGDLVITMQDGQPVAMPVVWIGQMVVDLENHPRPETAAPIVFRPNALGAGIPTRELVVSPDHAMFLDGKLIPAKLLINGTTIYQDLAARSVTYYHIETQRHSILLAEGAPAESYLDTGNRAWFNNAGAALMGHPEFEVNAYLRCWEADACAPLAVGAEAVGPIWQRLADRAAALGYAMQPVHHTTDADVHLVADGATVQPISTQDGHHIFVVPAGASDIRLGSRANLPSDLTPFNGDGRRLGVAVSRIVVRSGDDRRDVPLDHPALRDGWHKVERDQDRMWRWTNGSAALPISGVADTMMLEVHLQKMAAYRMPSVSDRIAA